MRSDHELLTRYQRGSEEAFAVFYDRHSGSLYLFLLSIVRSREAAEELLQETFCGLIGRLESLEIRKNMRPYLFASARNSALDWLRRESRFRRALQRRTEDPFFSTEKADGGLFERDRPDVDQLNRFLHRLPNEQRETVVLKDLLGLTFREISDLMAAPENTVVSRHRYAMAKLKSMVLNQCRSDQDG